MTYATIPWDTVKITKLFKAHSLEDQKALDELMLLGYKNMRETALYRLLGEGSDHTSGAVQKS